MVYNPFDYIKQIEDEEAKEVVKKLRNNGKSIRIRTDSYIVFGEDYDEWNEYLVKIEVMEKGTYPLPPLPVFTYKCHYTLSREDADTFRDGLRSIV